MNKATAEHTIDKFETKRPLPQGWRWVRLAEICRDISDGTHFTPTYVEQGIPFLSVKDIKNNVISFENCRYITKEQHQELCRRCKPEIGDVLYTKVGTTGIAKAIDVNCEFSIFVSVALLKLKSAVLSEYLEKVLNSPICKAQAENLTQGMANRNLVLQDLKKIELPLPPLPEQKRIAAILNEQVAAAEKARAAAEAQLEAAKALPAAYLSEIFLSKKKWATQKLGEMSDVVRGSSPRPKGDPRYYGGNVPRLMVEDVTRDGMYVNPSIDYLTEEGAKLSRPMKKNDVVIVVSGAPGLPAILDIDACIHDGFVGLRNLQTESIMKEFLYFFLKFSRETTDAQASGAIFRNLTTDQIKKIDVPLPNISEQKSIVSLLSNKLTLVKKTQQALNNQLDTINKLPASFLYKAFNGEI